ncbi:DUF3265 domain-containing protein [Vibrio parahaemolyticus]|nr:DUF3265 domain-containing protein [Vibrio parahaemolyticus]EJV0279346.1 DUF3265 domain-containing protein [Vibrio parahaemolyticus]ELX7527529.1 DUF3265 domain-containing protein [Vibrio parahaemolyticus]MDG2594786.1 DUF3265 domain-containing protein [Vibrio parahaemolyticus]HAS6858929.1 DUF3265 domain-containing protein [Vibrio parahaemolyticus]
MSLFSCYISTSGCVSKTSGQRTNKQFKCDSARVAFWVCGGFCVEVPCGNFGIACFTP